MARIKVTDADLALLRLVIKDEMLGERHAIHREQRPLYERLIDQNLVDCAVLHEHKTLGGRMIIDSYRLQSTAIGRTVHWKSHVMSHA